MPSLSPADLVGSWVHSHEEDTGALQVYRPADRPMPPARGRVTLTLGRDGALGRTGFGADDRTVRSNGRWKLDGERLTVHPDEAAPASFDVVSADADRLVLKPVGTR